MSSRTLLLQPWAHLVIPVTARDMRRMWRLGHSELKKKEYGWLMLVDALRLILGFFKLHCWVVATALGTIFAQAVLCASFSFRIFGHLSDLTF